MYKIVGAFSIFLLLIGCDVGNMAAPYIKQVDGGKMLANVMANMDPKSPGRGLADYPSNEPADVPKSYAMILLGAQAEARSNNQNRINELGVAAGNWLMENADANRDGLVGWGVPIAWDAYGDGSTNPANTEYSISTAIVVDALLGWLEYVDESKKRDILQLVDSALEPYVAPEMRTPAGLLPYSLQPHDRRYDTFNSAVYLAGQMQRYSELSNRPEMKERLQQAADETMGALLKNKRQASRSNTWFWSYSIQEDSLNDLPHAGYIIEGVLAYVHHGGRLANQFDIKGVFGHLMDFVNEDGSIRGWPVFRSRINTPPRLYDLSIAAQLMCRFQGEGYGGMFLGEIDRYVLPSGGYLKYPIGTEGNRQVAEYESYLYRALMACGFGKAGNAK